MLVLQVLGLRKKDASEEPDDFAGLTANNVFKATMEIIHHRLVALFVFSFPAKSFE